VKTDALIEALAADTRPIPRGVVVRRIARALLLAVPVVLALVLAMGIRRDLAWAVQQPTIWLKFGYTLALGAIGLAGLRVLVRPERAPPVWLWLTVAPVGVAVVAALAEWSVTPHAVWLHLWLGPSWRVCSGLIFGLSLPVAAALTLVARRLAPTRPRATGAVIGLASAATAAALYALHCPEMGAAFVLTWYSLGILASAGAGALLGPRLLRW